MISDDQGYSRMENIYDQFTPWTPWEHRERLAENLACHGVYVIAKNVPSPNPATKPTLRNELLYVGETCDQSLKQRLYQFHRSAFEKKPAHSGGTRMASDFEKAYGHKLQPSGLILAVLPVDRGEKTSYFIRYVERAIIWQHVERFDAPPKFNLK